MSGFSIDWLNLREDADRRARDSALLDRALQWLHEAPGSDSGPVIVDLGAGTGSTLRALSRPGSGSDAWSWRLLDHDTALLAEARRRHGNDHRMTLCPADLTEVAALPLRDARLITASALFDLVSTGFIDTLVAVVQSHGRQCPGGVYAALNYNGMTRWTPEHPLDAMVLEAFNRDQRRDKGFGPALGPEAGSCAERVFRNAGFEVHCADSPWELDGTDQALVTTLIEGIANAVAEDPRLEPAALRDWIRFRQDNAVTGTCSVGHTDILALPAVPDPRPH